VARTVLIVDDHAPFRSFARLFLEANGYRVVGEAGDGAAAIEAADRLDPDVVLLDVLLPDIDGFEVTRRILAGQRRPAVVLTSTRDASDYGRRIERCGASGFVAKADLALVGLDVLVGADGRSAS
jgi:DNA-binding NarL/FixJ family response regulator